MSIHFFRLVQIGTKVSKLINFTKFFDTFLSNAFIYCIILIVGDTTGLA